jgi:hypothetical protein
VFRRPHPLQMKKQPKSSMSTSAALCSTGKLHRTQVQQPEPCESAMTGYPTVKGNYGALRGHAPQHGEGR